MNMNIAHTHTHMSLLTWIIQTRINYSDLFSTAGEPFQIHLNQVSQTFSQLVSQTFSVGWSQLVLCFVQSNVYNIKFISFGEPCIKAPIIVSIFSKLLSPRLNQVHHHHHHHHPTHPQLSIKSKQVYTNPTSTYDTFLESLRQNLSNPAYIGLISGAI